MLARIFRTPQKKLPRTSASKSCHSIMPRKSRACRGRATCGVTWGWSTIRRIAGSRDTLPVYANRGFTSVRRFGFSEAPAAV